jgi:hypothetical protein
MGLKSKRRMTKGKIKQRIPEQGLKEETLKEEGKARKQGRSNRQF